MDLNIGTAFWFAARGEGYLRNYSDVEIDNFFNFKDNDVPLLRVSKPESDRPIIATAPEIDAELNRG